MGIKSYIKELAHWHKFTTLLVYSPHNSMCDKAQCKGNDNYGFLLLCNCGYTKPTKLPYGIKEFFEVRSKHNKHIEPTSESLRKTETVSS